MSWWAAAFQAVGSAVASRSSSRNSERNQQQSAAQRRQELMFGAAFDRNHAMWQRGNELEDRRYREEAMGSYRQFNRTPGIVSPEYSSTTPTNLALPEFVDPPKPPKPTKPRKKSLLGVGP